MASPSVVQHADAQGDGDTTIAITLSATTGGNLISVQAGANATTTTVASVTDNIGNTYGLRVDLHTNRTSEIWDCPNAGEGVTTVTVTFSANVIATTGSAAAYEISGAATSLPSAGTSSLSGLEDDTAVDMSVTGFTPSENDTLVIGGAFIGANVSSFTAGTDYTLGAETNRLGTVYRQLATAAEQTTPLVANYGAGGTRTWAMTAVAYKSAAVGGGGTLPPGKLQAMTGITF